MAHDKPRPGDGPTWRKLLWFAALWGAGVLAIALVGYGLRALFFM